MHATIHSFKSFIDEQLNEPQKQAVLPAHGSLLVIAGAGSGKTRVITARITNLILEEGVHPSSIVALTFTNKAAEEMKERIVNFLGSKRNMPFVGTFHAYCLQLLRSNPHLLPFPQFSILDSDDQTTMLKNIIKKFSLEKQVNHAQLAYQISSLKNSLEESNVTQPLIKELYQAYEDEKNNSHVFDFDDLIINVLRLFKKNSIFKTIHQDRVKHILVDEYQDTSTVQHELLREMGLTKEGTVAVDSICAVGDEDQSIYSWRGANVTNMLKFQHDFKPVSMIKIEQNYRSVNSILQAANSVISNNKLRNPKNLWSNKSGHQRILHLQCKSGDQEAEAIAQVLKLASASMSLQNVAILYRTHYQSRALEEALIYHSIPYKIVGGIRFYERKEIKDLIAYLKLLINPFDRLSLLRVVNTPTRGLGKKCETELLAAFARNPFFNFKEVIKALPLDKQADLSAAHLNGLNKFVSIFDGLDQTDLPSNILHSLLERTEYESFLRESLEPKEADEKLQNIGELLRAVEIFEKNAQEGLHASNNNTQATSMLELFLQEIALLQEKNDTESPQQQVQLMTLHAAKGLEFTLVIITGLDDGILPSTRSLNTNQELEEERRLFYVGITRAKEYLLLLSAHARNTYGQFTPQVKSRFLGEISAELFKTFDVERYQAWQINQLLQQWLANNNLSTAATPITSIKTYSSAMSRPIGAAKPAGQNLQAQKSGWYKNQKVVHKKFGPGIVTEVERVSNDEFYITAIFKIGKKKILSTFLQPA